MYSPSQLQAVSVSEFSVSWVTSWSLADAILGSSFWQQYSVYGAGYELSFGDDEVAAKATMTDKESELVYRLSTWDDRLLNTM
jgi:hypothetical protein